MANPNQAPMTFTFSTCLGSRKVKVDGQEKVIDNARYVDVEPMHVYVKEGDTLVFQPSGHTLTIDNWPGGRNVVNAGESKTLIVPSLIGGKLQLKFSIDGEDPRGKPSNEDPEIIIDPGRV